MTAELCHTVLGFDLYIDASDPGAVTEVLRARGIWEPQETAFVQDHVKPGMGFLDVGANVGYYTALAARLVGQTGRVIALEPEPNLCAILRRNAELAAPCAPVTIIEAAAGHEAGRGQMHLSPGNHGDHRMFRVPGHEPRDTIAVPVGRIDDLINGARVDFVKMDIQGCELNALLGMPFTLGQYPVLMLEYWREGLTTASGPDAPAQLPALLRGIGYDLYRLGAALEPFTDAMLDSDLEYTIVALPK